MSLKPNGEKKRQTIIKAVADHPDWNSEIEAIYAIVRDGKIMKLGGTRNGMKKRWGSYKCGHCVPERLQKKTENHFQEKCQSQTPFSTTPSKMVFCAAKTGSSTFGNCQLSK